MNQATIPDYSISSNSIKIGSIWEHYKGLQYKILAIARHHENLEELVVYQALYGNGDVWVRPLHSFLEQVEIKGLLLSRFKAL